MYQRRLIEKLSRNKPFCILGAKGVGKTTMIRDFAGKFSNWIHLDLETMADRAIFHADAPAEETLRAISFLKGKEIRGKGTLIVLDEIGKCPEAIRWIREWVDNGTGKQKEGPLVVATTSILTNELTGLISPENGFMQPHYLYPFSFEEFLLVIDDPAALEAFREVPVPYYAYEKLLNYFHLYALIGGMPEVSGEYAANRHLSGLKNIYEKIEERFIHGLPEVTASIKGRNLATEVLQNTYPYAATRISFSRFGNLEKGSREISHAFKALERALILRMVYPVTSGKLPLVADTSKFPRLQLLDTGLVSYFSGIQKSLFLSHDMNSIFEGQIARQVVGQEILATMPEASEPVFWVRNKAQSSAAVDFVIPFDGMVIPVIVRSGEPGRLRSLHQFVDEAPHPFAVRLYAGKPGILQSVTLRGKTYYLLSLPYFLAGKIREHLGGFRKFVEG
jgi:uncharacterized protein